MRVTLFDVRVHPEHVAEFIEVMRANHLASVRESGNLHVGAQHRGRFSQTMRYL